jgi:competence protein ComEC
MFVSAHRIGVAHWLAAWARVQWAITLALAPLLVTLFQQLSLISPLANALAIPLISLAVVPLTLAGVVVPGTAVLQAAHALMAACGDALAWLGSHPAAVWQQHAPPAWAVGVALAAVVWMLLPRGFPARWIGVFAMLPLFLVAPALLPDGALRLAVLDIGQGLAVVVQTRGHSLLYDAGTVYGPQADSGNRVIVPYLRASGVFALDTMIVSHADKDHAGGAASVLAAVPVQRVLSSFDDTELAQAGWRDAERCVAGQRWTWDGVEFEMLHPLPAHYAAAAMRRNDRSCVLRLTAGGQSILLTADIEQKTERELVQRVADRLPAQILLAPHHGSRTSSSAVFLAEVNPRHVIVAAGYRNRFGHPKDEVLDRYRALGSRIYRTDLDGALLVSQAADGHAEIRRQRAVVRRYWHAPLENPDLADDEQMPCSTC